MGYFTAITMCYFLVEGYHYTRSKKRYGQRLAFFALVSELPYCLAFTKGGVISYDGLNVIVNLFLCFLLIYVCDTMQNDSRRPFLVALLFLGSLFCDWSFFAPVFTLLFAGAREEGTKAALKDAYGKSI